jgi:hypothetical protein
MKLLRAFAICNFWIDISAPKEVTPARIANSPKWLEQPHRRSKKTIAANCTSSAKHCNSMVPAVKNDPKAISVKTKISGEAPRNLDTPTITQAALGKTERQ